MVQWIYRKSARQARLERCKSDPFSSAMLNALAAIEYNQQIITVSLSDAFSFGTTMYLWLYDEYDDLCE